MYIDLRPFMQRTPFVVHANASLSRTYRLFRTMGLHHVFVGPPKPMVMGVITRKVTILNAKPDQSFGHMCHYGGSLWGPVKTLVLGVIT